MTKAAVKWALNQKLPQTEKAVLLALARAYSPRWGRSTPTQSLIASEVGVTRETVTRTLSSLEKKGKISIGTQPRKKGQWDRNFYTLAPHEGGINVGKRPQHHVTEDHMVPCDFHQTRHHVTEDHTSRALDKSRARTLNTSGPKLVSGGGS